MNPVPQWSPGPVPGARGGGGRRARGRGRPGAGGDGGDAPAAHHDPGLQAAASGERGSM